MTNALLTPDELYALTKAKQPSKQTAVLDLNGIYYIKRIDGSIVTTWHHVNHPTLQRAATNDALPDFAAI